MRPIFMPCLKAFAKFSADRVGNKALDKHENERLLVNSILIIPP
jgi:hypothetical protein